MHTMTAKLHPYVSPNKEQQGTSMFEKMCKYEMMDR